MRRILLIAILSCFTTTSIFGQFTTDQITYGSRIDLENTNTWAIGGGFSNFIMHGDLRSIGTGDDTNYFNFGGYVYVDKMFNPLLGLELKASYNQISGGAQYFNNSTLYYGIQYADKVTDLNNTHFKGRAYGAELNLIFSFSSLFKTKVNKWNITGYLGVGYHQYNSALYERLADGTDLKIDDADFGNNPARNSVNEASSIYLSGQLGIKRRLTKKIDLEFRTGMYFNNEDHLDAAISRKQDWETFFVTSIGATVKLGKNKVFTILGDQGGDKESFKIIDSDGDGVMDKLDVEPNTPLGVMVYGNGKAVDSDKDGLPDHEDKCPLEFGPVSNGGCPLSIDTDGDGVVDGKDLCPNTPGIVENAGCPKQEIPTTTTNVTTINQQIGLLAGSIYFDTNSDKIKTISYSTIEKIIALMKQIPKINFVIEGHTDNTNTDKYNLYLSQRRAASVRKYMIRQGIPAERLESVGYGESRPKFSNADAGGRQLNRRVEVKPADSVD